MCPKYVDYCTAIGGGAYITSGNDCLTVSLTGEENPGYNTLTFYTEAHGGINLYYRYCDAPIPVASADFVRMMIREKAVYSDFADLIAEKAERAIDHFRRING